MISQSSGYFSTYRKETLKDSIKNWPLKQDVSDMDTRIPLPDIDVESASNVIFTRDNSRHTNNNWYLLKRLGTEDEGKFSAYRPSMQRNSTIFSDAAEGKIINFMNIFITTCKYC